MNAESFIKLNEKSKEISVVTNFQKRNFGENLNTWVQTIGILIAAGWGVWTFVYKEIKIPASAPTNISLNLQLKRVEKVGNQKSFDIIEMKVSATNPSSRVCYILSSAWAAYGIKLTYSNYTNIDSFYKLGTYVLNTHMGHYIEKHSSLEMDSLVAVGNLFRDEFIEPSESITTTIVFHVPRNEYDILEVHAYMPSVGLKNRVSLKWSLDEKGLHPNVYLLKDGGVPKKVENDDTLQFKYLEDHLGFQIALPISQLPISD